MREIKTSSNGFIRESEEGRAQFHKLSLAGWQFIGNGDILDTTNKEGQPSAAPFVTPYRFSCDGEEIEPHFDLEFLAEIELHMERGAQKYARGNWKLATDMARIFNAIIRHAVAAFKNKDTKENHEAAIVANALMMWNIRKKRKS